MSVCLACGAGCEPPVTMGMGELDGEALSGVVRGGRQSWILLHQCPTARNSASAASCVEYN